MQQQMQQQMQHHQQVTQQQDQLGNQQQQHNMVQQQMMLCPVRLVYETPYIVQQGAEQVQNQNIFLNPQNPPPWARPVQNQVIYVQQLQPNMMPNMIQQMDPNQLYLQQNIANYQQLITQQMINQNSQEQRQIQMQMQIPNMMQNVQNVQTIAPNIQAMQTEMPMGIMQNYATQQQTPEINVQTAQTQNQINLVPDPNNASRQIVSVQTTQTIHQNTAANQKAVELQRQAFYRNVIPQQNQQQVIRPQMPLAVNQVQNMTSIQQIQQLANQNFAQNLRPAQNPVQQIVANVQQNLQPVMMNNMAMQTQTQERTNLNLPNNTVTYSAVRNGQSYTFRAIQPKPPQPRTFAPMAQAPRQNMPPNAPNPNTRPPQNVVPNVNTSKPNQLMQPRPPSLTNAAPLTATIPTQTQTYKPEPQNRKRKSESPDEIQQKIPLNSTVYGSITVTAKAQDKFINKNIHNSQEMGLNTSPIHKPQYKVEITQSPVLQINPMDVNVKKIKEEHRESVPSPQHSVQRLPSLPILPTTSSADVKDHLKATLLQAEKERLARSTVFPQARGRLLNDKPNLPVTVKVEEKPIPIPKVSTDAFTQTIPKKTEIKPPMINAVKPELIVPKIEQKVEPFTPTPRLETKLEPSVTKVETKKEPSTPKFENKIETSFPKVESNAEVEKPKVKLKIETKTQSATPAMNTVKSKPTAPLVHPSNEKSLPKTSMEVKENILKPIEKTEKEPIKKEQEKKESKEKKEYKNISAKEMTGKEIHIVNGNVVKEDKDFVLTHVLDGYVIQESNVPFAIRKPLKEKTVTIQAKIETEKEKPKTDVIKEKPVVNERVIKDNSKILDLSHLQLNDGKVEEKDKLDKAQVAVKEEIIQNENPFSNVKSSVVKSWTVDQLTDHLAKHDWEETANILREHEIDGESLFLVSKSQLITIGVKECNADTVCEFVNSKL